MSKPQKSSLPQLVNYESNQNNPNSKESENTKALWRWQYGSNSNIENLNPTKNLISRSSSEGDDVIINFNEMTPMEYSKAIRKYENSYTNQNFDLFQEQQPKPDSNYNYSNNDKFRNANNSSENDYDYSINNHKVKTSGTEPAFNQIIGGYKFDDHFSSTQPNKQKETFKVNNPYSFTVSTDAPQWLDYESVSYKPKLMSSYYNTDNINKYPTYEYLTNETDFTYNQFYNYTDNKKVNLNEEIISSSTISPTNNMIHDQEKQEFQEVRILPKRQETIPQYNKEQVTTEGNINEMLRNNLFLRNLFKKRNLDMQQNYLQHEIRTESNMDHINSTPKPVDSETQYVIITSPKTIRNEPTPPNEVKFIEKKPLDMSDVLYYVINKNIFESNKLKSKRKLTQLNNDSKYGSHDLNNDSQNREIKMESSTNQNNFRLQPQQQEIRGVLKNYKVIQRNNVRKSNTEQENHSQNVHELKNQNIYSMKPHLGRAGPSTKSYLPPVFL